VWLSVDHHNLTLQWLPAIVLAWPTQCRSRGRRTSTWRQLLMHFQARLVLMCSDYRKHSLPGLFWSPPFSSIGSQEWYEYNFPVFGFLLCFSLLLRRSVPQHLLSRGSWSVRFHLSTSFGQSLGSRSRSKKSRCVRCPAEVRLSPEWETATCIIYCPLCWSVATLRIHWPVQLKVIGLWKGEQEKGREAAALSSIFSH